MKLGWLTVFAMLVLAVVSAAQDETRSEKQAKTSVSNSGVGSTQKDAVVKNESVKDASTSKPDSKQDNAGMSETEKRGYALGVQLAHDIMSQGIEANHNRLVQGLMDGLTGGKLLMTTDDINSILADLQKEHRERVALAMRQLGDRNKKEGEAFLSANKAKEGVVSLPSGLQYKILKVGNGKKPTEDDTVICNYRGTLIDGTEIDSSYKRNPPSIVPLKGVIKGWTEAMKLMPTGSTWKIFLPPDLAYGERGNLNIGPNATLIFEVELVSIVDKAQGPEKAKNITN